MTVSFAYIHAKPDGTPFYVGKGVRTRHLNFRDRNDHHKRIVNKYGSENILVGKMDCSSNDIALELEIGLIKCFRRMGVLLANFTDGGQGALGRPCSEKTKEAVASANKKRIWTKEKREAVGARMKGKARPEHSAIMKEKGLMAGHNNMWFGTGDRQIGSKNHMARPVTGAHKTLGVCSWGTLQQAAIEIGVSLQAVCQAIKKGHKSKGWVLEYTK